MPSFTNKQLRLITELKKGLFGWKKFADSVEKQGWCSPKQEETMCRMLQKLSAQRDLAEKARRNVPGYMKKSGISRRAIAYKHDISDGEAMSFGEYF